MPTQPYTCYKYSFRRKNLKMSTSNIGLQHVQTVDHGQYDNHLQGTLKSAWSEGELSSLSVAVDIPSSDMSDMSLNDKRYMLDRGDRTTTSSLWREFILQSRSRICRKEIGKPCFVQKIVYLHATFSAVGSPLLVVLWISKNEQQTVTATISGQTVPFYTRQGGPLRRRIEKHSRNFQETSFGEFSNHTSRGPESTYIYPNTTVRKSMHRQELPLADSLS